MHFSAGTFLAPYMHQFSSVVQIKHFFGAIWDKFELNMVYLASKFKKKYAETAPSYNAI